MTTNAELVDQVNSMAVSALTPENAVLLQNVAQELARLSHAIEIDNRLIDGQRRKIEQVTKHINDAIDNDDITSDDLEEPFWEELCEMLDIDTTNSLDVSVTVTYYMTVSGPRGMSTSNIKEELEFEEPKFSWGNSFSIESCNEEDTDVTER